MDAEWAEWNGDYAAAVAARRPWLTQSLVADLAEEIVGTVETSVARSL